MARRIVIASGKGGVGKTTVACYLAMALARRGQRVILCDVDFGLNNIDVTMQVEDLITYDIVDVIEGKCRAKQALVRHPKYFNLEILTSSHSSVERYVSPQSIKVVLDGLAPQYDFIIIDSPAGIDDGFHRAVALADEGIVVTSSHLTAIRDANKVITLLKSYHLNKLCLVVNRVRGDLLASKQALAPTEIEALLKIPLLGVIPEDFKVYSGEIESLPNSFKILASNLLTGKQKVYDTAKRYQGLLGSIKGALKRNL